MSAYDKILRGVESLSQGEQLRLISQMAENLRVHTVADDRTSILALKGLGKEIWRDLEAQEYVDRERASWNG
jgi:hypothetical protein